MNHFPAFIKTLTALVVGITAVSGHATPIQGSATLGGSMVLTFGEVDWGSPLNPGLAFGIPTYGSFVTSGVANTGSFATGAMTGVTSGLVQDMSSNSFDANFTPVGAGSTPQFIQFNAQPGWLFVMDFRSPGTGSITPFSLTNVNGNALAQLTVSGWACDTGGDGLCDGADDKSTWTGNFSASYINTSVAALENILLGGGSAPLNPWSGQIVATADAPTQVPEPSTLALFGLAIAALGVGRRRKA